MDRESRIALTLYTVKEFMTSPEQCRSTLKRVRDIGYRYVEIGLPLPVPLADFKTMLSENGLTVIDLHVGLGQFDKDYQGVLETARQLRCSRLTIPWLDSSGITGAAGWQELGGTLTALGRRLYDDGFVLQYHNHCFEFQHHPEGSGLELLYAASDPAFLKAQIDTHWVARGGGEPSAWIRAMAGRIDQVHCKDMIIRGRNEPVFAEVGQGNLNWPGIFEACKEAGVRDYIVEEDPGPHMPDPFHSVQVSFDFLRNQGIE